MAALGLAYEKKINARGTDDVYGVRPRFKAARACVFQSSQQMKLNGEARPYRRAILVGVDLSLVDY